MPGRKHISALHGSLPRRKPPNSDLLNTAGNSARTIPAPTATASVSSSRPSPWSKTFRRAKATIGPTAVLSLLSSVPACFSHATIRAGKSIRRRTAAPQSMPSSTSSCDTRRTCLRSRPTSFRWWPAFPVSSTRAAPACGVRCRSGPSWPCAQARTPPLSSSRLPRKSCRWRNHLRGPNDFSPRRPPPSVLMRGICKKSGPDRPTDFPSDAPTSSFSCASAWGPMPARPSCWPKAADSSPRFRTNCVVRRPSSDAGPPMKSSGACATNGRHRPATCSPNTAPSPKRSKNIRPPRGWSVCPAAKS